MSIIEYRCPKCGGNVFISTIVTYPPINTYRCNDCGWYKEEGEKIITIPLTDNIVDEELLSPNTSTCSSYDCKHKGLKSGDTLFQFNEGDTSIEFEKILNIRYCPLCGKKLKER